MTKTEPLPSWDEEAPPGPILARSRLRVEGGSPGAAGRRLLAEETPIALGYNGSTFAVMMGSPADLEDFAIGFSLSEGLIGSADELGDIEIVPGPAGIEARMWLPEAAALRIAERRRRLAGPVGCGLCGVESLAEALRRPALLAPSAFAVDAADIVSAMAALPAAQHLNRATRAVHAAALWTPAAGLVLVREDVGRHNALDKLVGAAARARLDASQAMALVTSRISVELVQKTAQLGAPILVAISAPTALAVREAEACGLTLVAVARGDAFEIFSHPERIRPFAPDDLDR